MVSDTEKRTLECLGHMMRIDETRLLKNVFETKPEDRRKVGRPKLRCMTDAENDLRELNMKRWRQRQIIGKNGHLS
jgi:hypothetical protein